MPDNENLKFDSKVRKIGGSYYLLVPPEIQQYLNLRHGSKPKLQVENGDFGKYASFWSPAQQENEAQE